MKKRSRFRLMSGLMLTFCLSGAAFSQRQEKTVTLKSVAMPLRLVARDIMQQTGSEISLEKDLAERKLICLVDKADEAILWNEIAKILGADCIRRADKQGTHFDLKLKPEVKSWLHFYSRSRITAKKIAADRLANQIYSDIARSLKAAYEKERTPNGAGKALTTKSDALRFARLMPDEAWRASANAEANGVSDSFGRLIGIGHRPIFLRPWIELPADDQQSVRTAISHLPETYQNSFGEEKERFITVSLLMGNILAMGISCPAKDDVLSSGYPFPLPVQVARSEEQRNTLEAAEMRRILISSPLPSEALLGFTINAEGICADSVQLTAKQGKSLNDIRTTSGTPSRAEALAAIAQNQHLNVVSDYYTDDRRMEESGNLLSAFFKSAASRFHCVFLEEDGYLLSRTTDFAAQDFGEAPYPVFEECIALRAKQSKNVARPEPRTDGLPDSARVTVTPDRLLPLNLLLSLCSLPHDQILKISRYEDAKRKVDFPDVRLLLNVGNSYAPEYIPFGMVNHAAPNLETSKEGVAFDFLPDELRELIRADSQIRASLQTRPMPPGARVRLRHISFAEFVKGQGADADPNDEAWYLDLIWTPVNQAEQTINFKIIKALPPVTGSKAEK